MAYDDTPRKSIPVRDGRQSGGASHDQLIDRAKSAGDYGVRTDAAAEGVGYLGMDDLDKMRRRKIK